MPALLTMRDVSKSFLGVRVLSDVSLDLEAGEVHALVGENGAGKSTLMKILAGEHQPDSGTIRIDGTEHAFSHPSQAQAAGIGIIQVDEPALRESLPLRRSGRADYLNWAVDSFRLATAGVADEVQIHTHMCYAEFGDVLDAIIAMDADVISLEAARSKMAIVADLAEADYPNEVGPGVWDIHSPRVPPIEEVTDQLRTAAAALGDRLWANPDCGLKTRRYPETRAALANLVTAARTVRAELDTGSATPG